MYAVIETGGKQYRVEVGTLLEIERLEAGPGESVAFERVLLVADGDAASIGRPVVANASVAAEVVRRERGEKLISFKYRPKARRRVKKGHRQELTVVRISDIVLDGKSAAKERAQEEEARLTERQRLEEGARRQAAKDAELAAKLAADAKTAKAQASTSRGSAKAAQADTTEAKDTTTSTKTTAKTTAKATATKRSTTATATPKATATTTPKAAAKTTAKAAAKATAKATGKANAADTGASDTKTARTRKGGED